MLRSRKAYFSFTLLVVLVVQLILAKTFNANAEEIPILVWERGQTQNIVLGQGEQNQDIRIFLQRQNSTSLEFSRSFKNSDGFLVYSINLSNKLALGGYFIVAKGPSTQMKQVAGVQIIKQTSKEVTRIPFELYFVLISFSIFLLLLQLVKNKNFMETLQVEKSTPMGIDSLLIRRLQIQNDKYSRTALLNFLISEELKFDSQFSRLSFYSGATSLLLLSSLQIQNGNWLLGNYLILFFCFGIGVIFLSNGILLFGISVFYLLLNIAIAKSLGDVLAIFFIGSLFVCPSLINRLVLNFSNCEISQNIKQRNLLINIISSAASSISAFFILLMFESLISIGNQVQVDKFMICAFVFVTYLFKNHFFYKRLNEASTFLIVRSISPRWSFILSFLTTSVIYLWTTNLLVSTLIFMSIFLIASTNWIAWKKLQIFDFFNFDGFYIIVLNLFLLCGIYFSLKVVPLDVINRSHLAIILTAFFDALLALFIWFQKPKTEKIVL